MAHIDTPRDGDLASSGIRTSPAYGAIDLGTNNCRLLVAAPQDPSFRVLDSYSRIVRLGEGVAGNNRLSDAAMARTIEALQVCAARLKKSGVTRFRGVATDACRRADNADVFVTRIAEETGLTLDIISTEEEARLALDSCLPLVENTGGNMLLFDIGGGSTELLWVRTDSEGGPVLEDWTSLNLGVVGLAERHGNKAISKRIFVDMVDEVAVALAPFSEICDIARSATKGSVQLLGTSGTVTTVAGLHLGLPRYDRARVDGLRMKFDAIEGVIEGLLAMSDSERAQTPCIGEGRGDVVLAGCAILQAIMNICPVGSLRAADRGLREGILLGMMRIDRVIA